MEICTSAVRKTLIFDQKSDQNRQEKRRKRSGQQITTKKTALGKGFCQKKSILGQLWGPWGGHWEGLEKAKKINKAFGSVGDVDPASRDFGRFRTRQVQHAPWGAKRSQDGTRWL